MKPDRTRLARRLLLALLVVVSGAVAWSLRRPPPRPTEPGAAASPGQGTTAADGALLRFREGREKVQVSFRAMVGREGDATRLSGVEVSLPFVAEGRQSRATITADECLYQTSPHRAAFKGRYILSGGYDAARANADLDAQKGDLVAFGRPFIANPDLVQKLQSGTALTAPDPATFYTPGALPDDAGGQRAEVGAVSGVDDHPHGGATLHAGTQEADVWQIQRKQSPMREVVRLDTNGILTISENVYDGFSYSFKRE